VRRYPQGDARNLKCKDGFRDREGHGFFNPVAKSPTVIFDRQQKYK
jgi:hypothetical protein